MKRNTPRPPTTHPLCTYPSTIWSHDSPPVTQKYPQMQFLPWKTCIYVFYLYIYLLSPALCLYQAGFGRDSVVRCRRSNNFRQYILKYFFSMTGTVALFEVESSSYAHKWLFFHFLAIDVGTFLWQCHAISANVVIRERTWEKQLFKFCWFSVSEWCDWLSTSMLRSVIKRRCTFRFKYDLRWGLKPPSGVCTHCAGGQFDFHNAKQTFSDESDRQEADTLTCLHRFSRIMWGLFPTDDFIPGARDRLNAPISAVFAPAGSQGGSPQARNLILPGPAHLISHISLRYVSVEWKTFSFGRHSPLLHGRKMSRPASLRPWKGRPTSLGETPKKGKKSGVF